MSMNRPPTESQPLHVSLAGLEETRMETALDVALERLAGMAEPSQPASGATVQPAEPTSSELTTRLLTSLIDAISAADCRTTAVEQLVQTIAEHAPRASVRCGLGSRNLRRYFDLRLGWLGNESNLREEAAERWKEIDETHSQRSASTESDSSQGDTAPSDPSGRSDAVDATETEQNESRLSRQARVIRSGGEIEMQLPQCDGDGMCVIWIGDAPRAEAMASRFDRLAATIAALFWSRPARSWPAAFARLGRRSKIIATALFVSVAIAAIWPTHYRVTCSAKVETVNQRLIATPFEASLLSTHVRPGDHVKEGDVLLVLDGRPLRLERESVNAEIQQMSKEHDVALATGRIADAQQSKLKRQQLDRRLEMLSDRLDRLEVVSPIDGVVVSGDLERYVGSPLELGQTLMEVAPMHSMLIEIEVPEHEIGYVHRESDTRVRFGAIGGQSLRMRLDDLFPSAEIRDDQNVFVGQVKVDNRELQLRPGMRGDAIVYGPLRPLVWSWVRGGVERGLWWVGY